MCIDVRIRELYNSQYKQIGVCLERCVERIMTDPGLLGAFPWLWKPIVELMDRLLHYYHAAIWARYDAGTVVTTASELLVIIQPRPKTSIKTCKRVITGRRAPPVRLENI